MNKMSICFLVAGLLLAPAAAHAQGLNGEYFSGMTLSGDPILTRIEAVNFNWGGGEPDPVVGSDTFSVRWTGGVTPPVSGGYIFGTRSDDGIRVWLNGERIIYNWGDHSATWNRTQPIQLKADKTYSIQVEFYENGGDAVCELYWSYPGQPEQMIPASSLSPEPVLVVQAHKPSPEDGATGVPAPLFSWTAADIAQWHDVYLGASPELTESDLVAPRTMFTVYWHLPGLEPGTTYYWRIDEVEADGVTVHTGEVWSFSTATLEAYSPSPRNGDKWIDPNVVLDWSLGQGATSNDVYFGTDQQAVANRDASVFVGAQLAPGYATGILEEDTTYYWAVDEHDNAGVKHEGAVWSFTTTGPGGGVKAEYFSGVTPGGVPSLTRIDPGIDFNWGDPGGPGDPLGADNFSARWTADLEIAVADTYTFITTTDDGARLWLNGKLLIEQWLDQSATDAFSSPIELEPGVYSLKMEYYESTGGAVARLSWRTPSLARQVIPAGPLQLPLRAKADYPPLGAVNVPHDVTLMWGVGDEAKQHHVYFGDDREAVANATTASTGIYRGQQALDATTYDPGMLEWNKTYYWRIDEVDPADADSPWKGSVWRFTTADFIVVDDFETYDDDMDAGTAIFQTWVDGFENATGSTVGYFTAIEGTFGETQIVHGGDQSMPLDYNNVNAPYYSEIERTFTPAINMTAGGMDTLTLFVKGGGANDPAPLYVGLQSGATRVNVPYGDETLVESTKWIEVSIPLADFAGVNAAAVQKMYIDIGNPDAPTAGGAGLVFVDDIRATKSEPGQ